jgi:ketosteroid isomerase-like protein
MKKIIFSFLAVLLITGCTPAEDKKSIAVLPFEEYDIAKEEEAIKQVVQAALDAFIAKSYEASAATWAHAPYIVRKGTTGWDSVSVYYQEGYKSWFDEPEDEVKVFRASNFDIYINGNFASVFHDEHLEGFMDGEELVSDSRGVHKYLEKIDGEWKVITLF